MAYQYCRTVFAERGLVLSLRVGGEFLLDVGFQSTELPKGYLSSVVGDQPTRVEAVSHRSHGSITQLPKPDNEEEAQHIFELELEQEPHDIFRPDDLSGPD